MIRWKAEFVMDLGATDQKPRPSHHKTKALPRSTIYVTQMSAYTTSHHLPIFFQTSWLLIASTSSWKTRANVPNNTTISHITIGRSMAKCHNKKGSLWPACVRAQHGTARHGGFITNLYWIRKCQHIRVSDNFRPARARAGTWSHVKRARPNKQKKRCMGGLQWTTIPIRYPNMATQIDVVTFQYCITHCHHCVTHTIDRLRFHNGKHDWSACNKSNPTSNHTCKIHNRHTTE